MTKFHVTLRLKQIILDLYHFKIVSTLLHIFHKWLTNYCIYEVWNNFFALKYIDTESQIHAF